MCSAGFDKIARFNPDFALVRAVGGEDAMNTVADPLGWKGMQIRTDERRETARVDHLAKRREQGITANYRRLPSGTALGGVTGSSVLGGNW